jgi:hypothetical protein
MAEKPAKKINRRPWSESEKAAMAARYANDLTQDIARDLGRPVHQVLDWANRNGLRKSAEFLSSKGFKNQLSARGGGSPTRFKPGHSTWNAGLKGWHAGGRSRETQFQPGQKPHTCNPIGHERVCEGGYLQRKVTDTGFTRRDYRPAHHIAWEAAGNPPVPEGCVLIFIDGNLRNFAPANLQLLTRAELMRRNSVHNHGPEIARITQLRGAIVRQINQRLKKGVPL